MPPVPTISTVKEIHTCPQLSNLRKSGNKHLQDHIMIGRSRSGPTHTGRIIFATYANR